MPEVDECAVHRLLAYKHRSHIGQIEVARARLGKCLEITGATRHNASGGWPSPSKGAQR